MGNFIDKIQISGTSYDVKDSSIDISQYWTSAQTSSAITEATSGKVDIASIVTAVTTASTDSEIPTAKAVNDAIEAGGGSITIDPTLDSGSTNPVANSAITNAIGTKADKTAALGSINFGLSSSKPYIRFDKVSGLQGSQYFICQINGKDVWGFTNSLAWKNWELVETSAITTSITSSSTDAQVPSAKAVYDALQGGGGGGGITSGEVQTMIDESISGKSDTTAVTEVNNALTAHTSNTQIHVTTAQTAAWDAKSDFSGDYNDLTNKPTIPTTTSAVTSGSTDVVESGAVYDQMGGMKIVKLTESEYTALVTKDADTLYIVIPDPSN